MPVPEVTIGDLIEYRVRAYRGYQTRTGTVVDQTNKMIVLDLGRYRDTILTADLITGEVVITSIKGGDEMSIKIERPSKEYLEELLKDAGGNICRAAKACEPKVSDFTMRKWLKEVGIVPSEALNNTNTAAANRDDQTETVPPPPSFNEPEENNDHEIIKKIMDFYLVPIRGKIDDLEQAIRSIAAGNQDIKTNPYPYYLDLMAELIIRIAGRVPLCQEERK
jgi:hypothetical protein